MKIAKPSLARNTNLLAWVTLTAAVGTIVVQAVGLWWLVHESVLIPAPERTTPGYMTCLFRGFFNSIWLVAAGGVSTLWLMPKRDKAVMTRLAVALSLVFVQQFLLLTVVFWILSSRMRP